MGKPAAFIELAWRRYTKHSRNKAGEIEAALYHLGSKYPNAFLGAIVAGEWSQKSLEQMKTRGINILHIPFEEIATTFDSKDINLRYEEKSSDDIKWDIIEQWNKLTEEDLDDLILSNLEEKCHPTLTADYYRTLFSLKLKNETHFYTIDSDNKTHKCALSH